MLIILKSIHLICLLGGGAAAIGNMVLMRQVAASGAPPVPVVALAMGMLGRIGLASVVLLWLTGLFMVMQGGYVPGWAFAIKLIGATVVLGITSWTAILRGRVMRGAVPPPMAMMKRLSLIGVAGTLAAIIFAVVAFS